MWVVGAPSFLSSATTCCSRSCLLQMLDAEPLVTVTPRSMAPISRSASATSSVVAPDFSGQVRAVWESESGRVKFVLRLAAALASVLPSTALSQLETSCSVPHVLLSTCNSVAELFAAHLQTWVSEGVSRDADDDVVEFTDATAVFGALGRSSAAFPAFSRFSASQAVLRLARAVFAVAGADLVEVIRAASDAIDVRPSREDNADIDPVDVTAQDVLDAATHKRRACRDLVLLIALFTRSDVFLPCGVSVPAPSATVLAAKAKYNAWLCAQLSLVEWCGAVRFKTMAAGLTLPDCPSVPTADLLFATVGVVLDVAAFHGKSVLAVAVDTINDTVRRVMTVDDFIARIVADGKATVPASVAAITSRSQTLSSFDLLSFAARLLLSAKQVRPGCGVLHCWWAHSCCARLQYSLLSELTARKLAWSPSCDVSHPPQESPQTASDELFQGLQAQYSVVAALCDLDDAVFRRANGAACVWVCRQFDGVSISWHCVVCRCREQPHRGCVRLGGQRSGALPSRLAVLDHACGHSVPVVCLCAA